MKKETRIEQATLLLDLLERRTTVMADSVYRQPVAQYISTERHEREREVLFRHQPLVLALSCELRKAGDYVTDDYSGVPVLAVRQDDGSVRGFINVCRHRGARLLSDRGTINRRLSCPYHAWTYGIDGSLQSIFFEEGFEGLDRACSGLRELPLTERHGVIWVVPGAGAELDFEKLLSPLDDDLAGFKLDGYHHFETREMNVAMNWKLVVDTFLESYHIGVLHQKTISPIIHTNVGSFDGLGRHLRTIYPRRSMDKLRGQPPERLDLVRETVMVYVLFPNTVFIMQGDHVETFRVYPGETPNRSRMHVSLYTPKPTTSDSARRHWNNNMDLLMATVDGEDFPLGEKMQRDFASGAQTHLTFGRNEPALAHFHRAVDQVIEA